MRELWTALGAPRATLAAMTLGVAVFATAHAALAFAAGSMAQLLGTGGPALSDGGALDAFLYVGLCAAIVKAATGSGLAYVEERVASRVGTHLRARLLAALLDEGGRRPPSHLLSALGVRVREVETAVSRGVLTWVRAAVQLLPLGACLVVLSPGSALLGAAALLPFAVLLAGLRRHLRRSAASAQDSAEELSRNVDELVRHADLFRTYGAGQRVLEEVIATGTRAGVTSAGAEARRAALSGGNEVLGALAVLAVAHLAPLVGPSWSGPLLPFVAVFFMAYRPLRDLGDAASWIARGEVALAALGESLHPGGVPLRGGDTRAAMSWDRPPAVELRGYGARERGPRTDLRLDPGEVVCLVGPTGAGKTTLIRALLGLEPEVGSLRVGGASLIDAPAGPGSRPFAWVPQEAPLVTGTVVDNAALLGAPIEEARAALIRLGAGPLLRQLGEVTIGPGGRELSGGERRLVALARALSSGLPILVLDEPTEGLDPVAARTVLDVISGLSPSRSVLMVTHRDDVTDIADRVVRLGTSTFHQTAAE